MQIVPTVSDDSTFTAVFALSTPAYDHSGLSHLAEHMVFRGSRKYPANHELFLINSLLPATINATTENGHTFYYVESKIASVFFILVDYLLSGILENEYSENEFNLEKDGVVYQELLMYEAMPQYYSYAKSIRGSLSTNNVFNYGGFSDLVIKNTMDRLVDYKNAHYRKSETTLYINAPNSIIDRVKYKILQGDSTNTPRGAYQHTPIPVPENTDGNTDNVLSFFIHCDFYHSIKRQQYLLLESFSDQETLVIEENLNQNALFAIRLISNNIEKTKAKFLKALKKLTVTQSPFIYETKKQKGFVREVISQHLQKVLTVPPCKALPFYLQSYEVGATNEIQDKALNNNYEKATITASRIANELQSYLSLKNIQSLPKLFKDFFDADDCAGFTLRNNNWLLPIDDGLCTNLISKVIQGEFWLPRINGECYAMGLGWHNNRLYLYGAQDQNAKLREAHLATI